MNLENVKLAEKMSASEIDKQISLLVNMVANKRYLVTQGMYVPEKLHATIKELKTINYRLEQYEVKKRDVVSDNFYNKIKILYDNLLFDMRI